MNQETELTYTEMQNSIKSELLTLNEAKKLVMQCVGLGQRDQLNKAVEVISAEIGFLEAQFQSNQVEYERLKRRESK